MPSIKHFALSAIMRAQCRWNQTRKFARAYQKFSTVIRWYTYCLSALIWSLKLTMGSTSTNVCNVRF